MYACDVTEYEAAATNLRVKKKKKCSSQLQWPLRSPPPLTLPSSSVLGLTDIDFHEFMSD